MAAPKKTAATTKTEEVAKKAATVKAEEVKAEEKKEVKAEEVKAEEKKAEEKKVTEKKTPGRKPAAKKETAKKETAKKETAKKETAKKETADAKLVSEIHIQFSGKSYSQEDLIKMAKDVWKYDLKRKVSEFRSAEFYVKPEESMVYYVINKEVTGSFYI